LDLGMFDMSMVEKRRCTPTEGERRGGGLGVRRPVSLQRMQPAARRMDHAAQPTPPTSWSADPQAPTPPLARS